MFTPPISSDALFHRKGLLPVINPDQPGTGLPHPAPRAPRVFADSATRADIEPLFRAGIINGITTNPSLLKKAGATSWEQAKTIMRDLCALLHPHPVSLELTETREEDMVKQASELSELGDNSVIKVPIGGYRALDPKADPFTGLKVIRRLWQRGIKVNTTLVFNTTQALWAANAGAVYVSPFLGRLADYALKNDRPSAARQLALLGGRSSKRKAGQGRTGRAQHRVRRLGRAAEGCRGTPHLRDRAVFANYRITTEILAASIRNPVQLTECLLAGADILTVPAPVLSTVADHPLSDAGMKAFAQDASGLRQMKRG